MNELYVWIKCVYEQEYQLVLIDPKLKIQHFLLEWNRLYETSVFKNVVVLETTQILYSSFHEEVVQHGDHLIVY
ncbi:hypothetical protein [Dubosiella newyorkensis]|uniref:Uncharacterized protein n=2 Tax=Dubosiella newyorkensis TaxID=1862672 RepID=A0A1U7NQN9_9FIRM|nr:hypothetical protein [Dubosiella newyorkensis]OLU47954.1 hypothetical protein BO225_00545 [Dubosiella newyorkensis]